MNSITQDKTLFDFKNGIVLAGREVISKMRFRNGSQSDYSSPQIK